MKKLIAVLLMIAVLFSGVAFACDETTTVLVAKSSASFTFTDASYWGVTEDHMLAGIKEYGEQVVRLSVQHVSGMYVAGCVENGWIRYNEPGANTKGTVIRTINMDGCVVGLTKLTNVTVTIDVEYVALAEAIVHNLLGDDVCLSANSIAACAMWWEGDYVSTIFHPSYSDRFVVGSVTFNGGKDVTPLYLGHFDEELRFGLACGFWIPDPVVEEEVVAEEEHTESNAVAEANATATATARACISNNGNGNTINNSGDGCYRNNLVIQINVGSFVKNCIRFFKECAE